MLVFSVVNRKSFDVLPEVRRKIEEAKKGGGVPIMVVGNKSDLTHMRQITRDEGKCIIQIYLFKRKIQISALLMIQYNLIATDIFCISTQPMGQVLIVNFGLILPEFVKNTLYRDNITEIFLNNRA